MTFSAVSVHLKNDLAAIENHHSSATALFLQYDSFTSPKNYTTTKRT